MDYIKYLVDNGFCTHHTAKVILDAIEKKDRSNIAFGLAIDGGGIKGITSIAFLNYIFGNQPIGDFFDLMAGTSTGGIIVSALGACKNGKHMFSNRDVLDMYQKPKDLFRKNWFSLKGLFSAKYKSNLKEFKEIFGDTQIQDTNTNLLITAYNYTWDKMKYFKNSRPGYYMYQVLAATSAAPTYFPSLMLENHERNGRIEELLDGGVGANDPSFATLTEMNLLRRSGKIDPKKEYNLLLRIGTINKHEIPRGKAPTSIFGTIPNLTKMFMGVAESLVNENVLNLMDDEKTLVLNIDIPLEKGSSEMDNISSKNIQALLDDTEKFIEENTPIINLT